MTTVVETYVDPSCPWAWITARWLVEVAPQRGLALRWPSYCLAIRDDHDAQHVPPEHRARVVEAHAVTHGVLRAFEAVRAEHGEEAVDRLYAAWGDRFFADGGWERRASLLGESLAAAGLDAGYADAAEDPAWDDPIRASMEIAYAFGGPKTQTPCIVVRADEPYGFKGPVMAPAPTGEAALRLWDAVQVLAAEPGFYEITRPRRNPPRPPAT